MNQPTTPRKTRVEQHHSRLLKMIKLCAADLGPEASKPLMDFVQELVAMVDQKQKRAATEQKQTQTSTEQTPIDQTPFEKLPTEQTPPVIYEATPKIMGVKKVPVPDHILNALKSYIGGTSMAHITTTYKMSPNTIRTLIRSKEATPEIIERLIKILNLGTEEGDLYSDIAKAETASLTRPLKQ